MDWLEKYWTSLRNEAVKPQNVRGTGILGLLMFVILCGVALFDVGQWILLTQVPSVLCFAATWAGPKHKSPAD